MRTRAGVGWVQDAVGGQVWGVRARWYCHIWTHVGRGVEWQCVFMHVRGLWRVCYRHVF